MPGKGSVGSGLHVLTTIQVTSPPEAQALYPLLPMASQKGVFGDPLRQ
ncbi:MAG: hypothetical protein V2B15_00835 [Bacteroidota bacterium]